MIDRLLIAAICIWFGLGGLGGLFHGGIGVRVKGRNLSGRYGRAYRSGR
jgi:hypothetical protein